MDRVELKNEAYSFGFENWGPFPERKIRERSRFGVRFEFNFEIFEAEVLMGGFSRKYPEM